VREYRVPALAKISASAGLDDVVFRRARAEPGSVMLRRRTPRGGWEDVTSGQFRAEVTALARGIIGAGIEPGDRVGLMSRTRYEWTLIDYAIWAAGAVTVPVYETSSAGQVEWILADSAARAVFAETRRHEQIISSARGSLPSLEHLWMIDALDMLASGGAHIGQEQLDQRRACRTAADLATIVYTSGTTGRPKGCQLTHGNLLADVRNAVAALPEIFTVPEASTLLFLPLAHAFARIIEVGVLEAGVILGHWPEITTLADGLGEFHPTFLLAVPRVFEKAYDGAQRQAAGSKAKARIFTAAAQTAIAWSKASDGAAAGRRAGLALRLRHALFDQDLIITAGGTNVAPAVLEDRVRAHPLVSQCMVVGEGRPYIACLVTLDPETLELWKRQHRRAAGATPSDLANDPQLIKEIQLAVDEANKTVSRAESIRRFRILGTDFTEASGQLTPSAKVRRDVVTEDFAADIHALYRPAR
jgi:long-chain acyl-CoA synthetase